MLRQPHIKICGLTSLEAVEAVLARGGPEIGFVHFAKSPRHLSLDRMAALRAAVGSRAGVAVVTVDPDDDLLDALVATVRPDTIQLHGHETTDRVRDVAARTGLAVMKAVSIRTHDDLAAIPAYSAVADRLLLDAKAPEGADLPGGNGQTFDWSLLSGFSPDTPYMLSGGLTADNVGQALARLHPYGLDVSSGVESSPGVKDIGRIDAFFDAVAAAPQPERSSPAR